MSSKKNKGREAGMEANKIFLTLNKYALGFLFIFNGLYGQKIASGDYGFGLKLAYNSKTNKLSGYFENYTGWDESTNSPRFSCMFYIEGSVESNKFKIKTYFPGDKLSEAIEGTCEIVTSNSVKIKLPEEHGGCWNVQHFADEPVKFNLEKAIDWVDIRYVIVNKTYFHSQNTASKKQKAYIIKNNIVCVEKLEGDWAFCAYYGKKTTKGWIKTSDLNKL